MKLDIAAVAAHPDDVELSCGGTLAAMAQKGKKTGILDLTRGEMGTRGTPEQRLEEAQKAAEILGASVRENTGLPDCGLDNTASNRKPVIRFIRRYRPDICLINAPDDRHPDHRNAARLVADALFYAGLPKLITHDETGRQQEPWRPRHVFHFMQHWPFPPTLVIDISHTMDTKEKAIRAFSSQFDVPDNDPGPQTYVSSRRFFKALRGGARAYGQQIGVTYGEPFLYYGGPLPVSDFDFLKS